MHLSRVRARARSRAAHNAYAATQVSVPLILAHIVDSHTNKVFNTNYKYWMKAMRAIDLRCRGAMVGKSFNERQISTNKTVTVIREIRAAHCILLFKYAKDVCAKYQISRWTPTKRYKNHTQTEWGHEDTHHATKLDAHKWHDLA